MNQRESALYAQECPSLPHPHRRPLRVPRRFDYLPLRDHFSAIVEWMVVQVARRYTVVGPHVRFSAVGRLDYAVDGDADDFLRRVRRAHYAQRRVGVLFLSYRGGWEGEDGRDHRSGHRSVVLCDARSEAALKLYVVDPNGSPNAETRRNGRKALKALLGAEAEVSFVDVPRFNESSTSNAWDASLGIEATEPGAYCVYASLLITMDVLCVGTEALSKGHFLRLSQAMVGPSRGDAAIDRYNRLMAIRSFAYEIVWRMKQTGAWTRYVPPPSQAVGYHPEFSLSVPPPPPP